MGSSDIDTMVRFVAVTSLASLLVVCLGFSAAVWGRRNRFRLRSSTGLLLALVACGALVVTLAVLRHAMTVHEGIVEARDVFTIRSKTDAVATVLAGMGPVRQGDPLARFEVPGLDGRLASLDSRIMTLREQLRAADLQPLQLDAAITEGKRRLSEESAQRQSILVDLEKSSRENHRAALDTEAQFAERLGQIDLQIDSNKAVSRIAASQLSITQDALSRAQYLRQQGIENVTLSENRLTDRLSRELTLNKAASDIAALERMKADLQAMRVSSTAFQSAMQTSLDGQIDEQRRAIAALQQGLEAAGRDEASDRRRAEEARRHGREAMGHEIRAIEAEKGVLLATTTVQAPFAGTVIYRNSAPGIVSDNSLLVALAPASGFTARVRMATDEAGALDRTRPAVFELADATLMTHYVSGLYKTTAPAPMEGDQSIVSFDISLPTDVIERLTRSVEPIGLRLVWTAPLWGDPLFRSGLVILGAALLLSAATRLRWSAAAGAAAMGAARLLLPVLWLCQPTEAIAAVRDRTSSAPAPASPSASTVPHGQH